MATSTTTLKEQQGKKGGKLRKTHRELKVGSEAMVWAQHLALSKGEEIWLCCQQLEAVKDQLDLPGDLVTIAYAASTKADVRCNDAMQIFHVCKLITT